MQNEITIIVPGLLFLIAIAAVSIVVLMLRPHKKRSNKSKEKRRDIEIESWKPTNEHIDIANMPDDPDEAMAWLEQLAAEQERSKDK
ncbi:MAG: hypothetical protein KJ063_25185 [Anaerolineae bacterium]|nr:hypothetical protein [Anaerolineae bacterium]